MARSSPHTPLPLVGKLLHLLSSLDGFFYPLVLGPLYLSLGPWFVGEVLTGSIGIVFCWGTFVSGSFLPTATSWLYGAYHLATTHLPLVLLLATSLNSRREHDYSLVRTLRNNGLMLVIVLKQVWLVHAFYNAYGFMAVIFGPFRTGYLILTVILWRRTFSSDYNQPVIQFHDYKTHSNIK